MIPHPFKRYCIRCNLVFNPKTKHNKVCDKCTKESIKNRIQSNRFKLFPELIKVGKTFGYTTCPDWLKLKYQKAVNFTCQICNHQFTKPLHSTSNRLEIHRIKRGNVGGLYTVCKLNHPDNNVKVLCKECHSRIHYKEFHNGTWKKTL